MFVNFLVTLWDWAFDFGVVGHPLYKCAMQSSLRYYEMNISKWACKDPCNDNATKKRFWSMNTISFLFKAPISSSLGQSQSSLTLKITITSIWLIFCFLFCLFNKAFFIFCFTSLLHTFFNLHDSHTKKLLRPGQAFCFTERFLTNKIRFWSSLMGCCFGYNVVSDIVHNAVATC